MESPLRGHIPDGTQLIETFGFVPGRGIARLDLHLDRMCHSARALGFAFDAALARMLVNTVDGPTPLRCRMTLDMDGQLDIAMAVFAPAPQSWKIMVSRDRLTSSDPWLAHKTTQRDRYDQARAALPRHVDEMIFMNQDNAVCEGTITNVFLERDGMLLTPPLSAGALPGVLRRALIEGGTARVATLTMSDLKASKTIFCGNSLRGLVPAVLV
ncbi:MAG: aminotransferase class IV family protein [Planktomarina sp.]